ncbi:MAG: hypothetical protein EOO42_17900 [Flavobacteriales bacterium]|nr:MAG: hypothetical protein EOO42_17900 [Flavobacteriales bacterium]
MKKYILSFTIFLSFIGFSNAQSTKKTIEEIEKTLFTTIDAREIKDSIALYTFSIKINIRKTKGKVIVNEISSNDPIAHLIFKDVNLLGKINFAPLVANKNNVTLYIPVAYIVANYKLNDTTEKKISLNGLQENLYKLFNFTKSENSITENTIYMRPIVITTDKAVYD